MAFSFRALFRWLLPGNYTAEGTEGEKVLYSLALLKDAVDTTNRARLEARFPSRAGESALALLGADRGIIRGRAEPAANYAQRLISWRWPRGHRVRGSGFALLEQIGTYFGGGFAIRTVQQNGLTLLRSPTGVESDGSVVSWDWDGDTNDNAAAEWARAWVLVDGSSLISITPNFGDPALYGGQLGDSSHALGHLGVSARDVNAIRRMLRGRAWKAAGTRVAWAIVSLAGAPAFVPSGQYGRWAVDNGSGNYVAARSASYRYWALDPAAQLYAGDPSVFPASSDMPGGGTYAGDPSVFPASAVLPGGAAYAGVPVYRDRASLVDDGSIP